MKKTLLIIMSLVLLLSSAAMAQPGLQLEKLILVNRFSFQPDANFTTETARAWFKGRVADDRTSAFLKFDVMAQAKSPRQLSLEFFALDLNLPGFWNIEVVLEHSLNGPTYNTPPQRFLEAQSYPVATFFPVNSTGLSVRKKGDWFWVMAGAVNGTGGLADNNKSLDFSGRAVVKLGIAELAANYQAGEQLAGWREIASADLKLFFGRDKLERPYLKPGQVYLNASYGWREQEGLPAVVGSWALATANVTQNLQLVGRHDWLSFRGRGDIGGHGGYFGLNSFFPLGLKVQTGLTKPIDRVEGIVGDWYWKTTLQWSVTLK